MNASVAEGYEGPAAPTAPLSARVIPSLTVDEAIAYLERDHEARVFTLRLLKLAAKVLELEA